MSEKFTQASRDLRNRQTDAESKLWHHLRARRFQGLKFRRQYVIKPFIVDFICLEQRLIVELDGSQHLEQHEYDTERTVFLTAKGYEVVRFWNNVVLQNIRVVLTAIYNKLEEKSTKLYG